MSPGNQVYPKVHLLSTFHILRMARETGSTSGHSW